MIEPRFPSREEAGSVAWVTCLSEGVPNGHGTFLTYSRDPQED